MNKSDNSLHSYFLEVDLHYPKELHDIHNDYSMAPKKMKIEDETLSPYSFQIKNEYDIKTGGLNKLAPNLMSKKNYGVHYKNLPYYLSQGLTLKKVHRKLEFKQSDWMKPYNLFKLLDNVVYRKTIENMRNRMKIRITTEEKNFLKYAWRSTYISHKKFGKNLVVIHEKKRIINIR